MLPKRKLIKKLRSQKNNISVEQTQVQFHQSIFEKLKSINPAVKQQAVSILANLHVAMAQFFQPQFSRQLVNLLYQANNSLVYQTLFAMANLCELQPALIKKLFENGLDKGLMQLPSSNNQLLKPILIFFITVCENLPKKYYFLVQGIRNSLTVEHIKYNTQLCLQFIFRTYNITEKKLSQQLINSIVEIFKTTQSITIKSYSVAVISKQVQGNKQVQQILINYMTELLVCIDLAQEYQMNFNSNKNVNTNNMGQQNKIQEGELNQDVMEEDQQQSQKKNKTHTLSPADRQKLKFFIQTINGIQVLLEFILDLLQKEDEDSFEDEQQEEEQEKMAQQQMKQSQTPSGSSQLKLMVLNFIKQNMPIFPKFLSLSSSIVPDSQNIVYLFYHLLMHIDKHLQSSSSNNQQIQTSINQLIQVSLHSLFNSIQQSKNQQQNGISLEQYQILVQCLQIGLGVLMKNKGVGVTQDWLINFGKKYMMQDLIFKSIKLLQQIKPCWLIMLQLYSKVLNPQKNNKITQQQNYALGEILKQLIIKLPYTQLEQFRCQVIDTLFDVYSNETFDKIFVQLGFLQLLNNILKQANNISKKQSKGNKNSKKKQKFVQDVIKDIKRFLQYKHKMIKL